VCICICRSQCPRGLRRRSAAAWLLGSRVRIPLGAWMFVSYVYVLSRVGRGLCDGMITRPEEPYRVSNCVCDHRNPESVPMFQLGNTGKCVCVCVYVCVCIYIASLRPQRECLAVSYLRNASGSTCMCLTVTIRSTIYKFR
jgi:hypothetical protein